MKNKTLEDLALRAAGKWMERKTLEDVALRAAGTWIQALRADNSSANHAVQ